MFEAGHKHTLVQVRFGSKQGNIVSQSELAKIFGTSTPTIRTWEDDGMPCIKDKAGTKKQYDTAACMKWRALDYIEKTKEQYGSMTNTEGFGDDNLMTLDEARRRKEIAVALQAEVALAKEREQLANIDDLMNNFADALVRVRAKLASLPSRASGILAYQEEKEIEALLDAEVTEILNELSEYKHEYIGNESGSEK